MEKLPIPSLTGWAAVLLDDEAFPALPEELLEAAEPPLEEELEDTGGLTYLTSGSDDEQLTKRKSAATIKIKLRNQ